MTAPNNPTPEVELCPFCGGSNSMMFPPTCNRKSEYNPADRAFPIVKCMGCYAEVSGENWDETGKSAVEAWNKRDHHATVARLTAEQDEAVADTLAAESELRIVRKANDKLAQQIVDDISANKLLSERVAVLESALEPFAKAIYWNGDGDVPPDHFLIDEIDEWRNPPTAGDFRRARAAREAK